MPSQKKPRWNWLALVGLVFGIGLVVEGRLPFSPAADAWLLGFGVLLFYGAITIWIEGNRDALDWEPQPLNCVGQPIFDPGLVGPDESKESSGKQDGPAGQPTARAFGRSELV